MESSRRIQLKAMVAGVACAITSMVAVPAWADSNEVTLYSADGLHDGSAAAAPRSPMHDVVSANC